MRLVNATLAVVLVAIVAISSQATTGAIAGVVKDRDGGVLTGATVTIVPASGPRQTAVTRSDGSFRIADLPPGRARIQVKLPGFESAMLDADVKAGADSTYDVVLFLGFQMGARPVGELKPAPAEIEMLVKQGIEALWDLSKIPDGALLRGSTNIAVREELPQAKMKLSVAALPQRSGVEFRLIPQAATQDEADRTAKPASFLIADMPRIDGDTSTVWIGVDITLPRIPRVIKTCCCVGHGEFTKKDNRWTFVRWLGTICS